MRAIKRFVTGTVLGGALTSSLAMAQQVHHPVQDNDGDEDDGGQITVNGVRSVTRDKLAEDASKAPQSITVVSHEVMVQQATSRLEDALRNVPGITLNSGEGAARGDTVNLRGFTAFNDFFLDGVRDEHKKDVMRLVHEEFTAQMQETDIERKIGTHLDLPRLLEAGGQPLVLISSYRLTRSKSPHWVVVTDCDEDFVYLHDPDVDHSQHRQPMDCQHVPVSHGEFEKMSRFGRGKLRAAVVLYDRPTPTIVRL